MIIKLNIEQGFFAKSLFYIQILTKKYFAKK